MKKTLLLTLVLATTFAFSAKVQYHRSSSASLKQINTQGHAVATPKVLLSIVDGVAKWADVPANALEIPVNHSLGKNEPDNIALYTTIDGNGDGQGWKVGGFTGYSVCLTSNSAVIKGSDDWMVTPPIHLLPNVEYSFKFEDGCATTSSKGGKIEVNYGPQPTVEAMTKVLFADPEHTANATSFTEVSRNFTVVEEGYYYFGFHAISPKGSSIKIRNLAITVAKAEVDVPAAGELSYTLAPKGELKAAVKYIAPTKTKSGADLTAISEVVISVNKTANIQKFANVTPGQTIEFETALLHSGNNKIEAIAYVDGEPGDAVTLTSIYCGPDNPKIPTNPKIVLADDNKHVTVSWDPVGEVGESGGYVDVAKVTYYIFDAFGSYYDPAIASTTETSYTFDYSDWVKQDFVAYQITAGVGEDFYSLAASTGIVLAGDPEVLPYSESFANADFTQIWAMDPLTTNKGWYAGTINDNELQINTSEEGAEPIYLNSQDGDNGLFMAMPMAKDAIYGMQSAKINIATAKNPVIEFWAQGMGSNIDVMVAREAGEFASIKTIKFKETPTTKWTLYRFALDDFKSAKYIRIALRLTAVDNTDTETWSIPLDNIRVRDLVDNDLRIFAPIAPKKVKAGESVAISARIENLGTKDCSGASAELYVNDKLVETKAVEAIVANGFAPVSFAYATDAVTPESLKFAVKIVSAGDAVERNNMVWANVAVIQSILPAVSGLNSTVVGENVTLSWTAPDLSAGNTPVAVVEDFESADYTPLTISDFGGWTLVDGDKKKTYNILRETNNPYQTQPQAFQLFNPIVAAVPESSLIDAQPHSGNQFLVAWSAGGAANDNWLISPELSGAEQTIFFFAKSFSLAWPESFEVLYSSTDKQTASFVKIESVVNYPENGQVPEVWTEFKAVIPAGAKYFAIHHNSYDSGALYVDDISFSAAPQIPADLAVLSYNIYRDGKKINQNSVTDTKFDETPLAAEMASGDYKFTYQVAPLYNHGEGIACAPIEVSVGHVSIAEIAADQNTDATYYNLQGIKVAVDDLTTGVYIRTIAGKAEKIVITK
ncbi:MAG: choice-of-anchor J domain-containing protein [Muribaculaceae bacterium]|nr:choice-of-anchor J domain-containing protein [Muribaculaceae bacterium]